MENTNESALIADLYKQIKELKKELQEVREDNKKLACQIEDYVNQLRKVALL